MGLPAQASGRISEKGECRREFGRNTGDADGCVTVDPTGFSGRGFRAVAFGFSFRCRHDSPGSGADQGPAPNVQEIVRAKSSAPLVRVIGQPINST